MKLFLRITILFSPLLIFFLMVVLTVKTSSELILITEINSKKNIIVDKYASKRRVYFFVKKDEETYRYQRNYSGFVTNFSKKYEFKNLDNKYTLKMYVFENQYYSDEIIPFFSLNNVDKNFKYYNDIYQYKKEKFYFILLGCFVGYIIGAGWVIDNLGGLSANNKSGIIYFVGILFLSILFFW